MNDRSEGRDTRVGAAVETIAALSSGGLPAGIAVVRASGPAARSLADRLAGSSVPLRRPTLRDLRDPASGEILDRGIVLVFDGPGTATGEDVAEFHVHGSRAVVAAVLGVLSRQEGVRLAEPGEFTRRAFLSGRMDLTEVEGLSDLIAAETAVQRRQALRIAAGGLRSRAEGWRRSLVSLRAAVEAELDFADEADVEEGGAAAAVHAARALSAEIAGVLDGAAAAERIADGIRVALVGAPNAGKSSLVNRIAERDVAIVTEIAGTTRDVLEVHLDLGGYPVTLLDTAGLRESSDPVEAIGIARARAAAEAADLVVEVQDATAPPTDVAMTGTPRLVIVNKCDLAAVTPGAGRIAVSAATGKGIDRFLERLKALAEELVRPAEGALVARSRQRAALEACREALERVATLGAGAPLEVLAEELRTAGHGLGRLTGTIDVEEILDDVFGRFCIGK